MRHGTGMDWYILGMMTYKNEEGKNSKVYNGEWKNDLKDGNGKLVIKY